MIDKGGVIVTNAHVVKDAQDVQVRVEDKGDYLDADVLGVDEQSDLAVLRVGGRGLEAQAAAGSRTPTRCRSATRRSRSASRSG